MPVGAMLCNDQRPSEKLRMSKPGPKRWRRQAVAVCGISALAGVCLLAAPHAFVGRCSTSTAGPLGLSGHPGISLSMRHWDPSKVSDGVSFQCEAWDLKKKKRSMGHGGNGQSSSPIGQEVPSQKRPRALLLYPDAGSPGFVEAVSDGSTPANDWPQAAQQLTQRVAWDAGSPAQVDLHAMSLQDFCASLATSAATYGAVLGVDLADEPPSECADKLASSIRSIGASLFITSSPGRQVGPYWRGLTMLSGVLAGDLEDAKGPIGVARAVLGGWSDAAQLKSDIEDLWHRRTAEEAVYAMLVFIDGALIPLDSIQIQKPVPTLETLSGAIGRCQDEFRACFTNVRCLQSLSCLSNCGLADQSCSYKCIVSYQTEAFTQFSLCALQKNNLLNSQVTRPTSPQPLLPEVFRGNPLTFDLAEDILVGHYDPEAGNPYSWIVAAGSNPAYERFAWQYQLWYRGSKKNSFWYHPTFLVDALDGRKIWRTRDYRVRRSEVPGMWEFSVLDNGIISEEKWHLLGADDDLRWIVVFSIGAARRAGIFYRDCLVLTPDGKMPTSPSDMEGITTAVARAGMKLWELERCCNPPLDPENPPPLIAPATQAAAPLLQLS